MEAAQKCNVVIEGVEPRTEWKIEVISKDGEQTIRTIIDFVGAGVKK